MRLALHLGAVSAILISGFASLPAEAIDRRVRIHNDTGLTMVRFYSTNTGAKRWGSDILGTTTLDPGESVVMNFDNTEGHCLYDFRAIFEDGTDAQRQGINVCEIADYYYQP